MSVKSVFIVWASHSRRAETLAAELGGQVSFQYEVRLEGRWLTPLRYLVQGWKTWRFLERERPEVVLVQSPPIFAPLVVAIWCRLPGKVRILEHQVTYAIDCHPATFYSRRWQWTLSLMRFLSQRATVTLSSNLSAQEILHKWKVRGFFLADGVPSLIPTTDTIGSEGESRVAVISTFANVEPITEAFDAARLLPKVTFYVTGDPKRAKTKLLRQKPENVILTGFLRGSTYAGLLKNVHGIVILTNQPRDLSCAAYEAVAAVKPTVISDWLENRRCFTRGFIYVSNTPEAIAEGIKKMLNEQEILASEVKELRSVLAKRRQPLLEELTALLGLGNST